MKENNVALKALAKEFNEHRNSVNERLKLLTEIVDGLTERQNKIIAALQEHDLIKKRSKKQRIYIT